MALYLSHFGFTQDPFGQAPDPVMSLPIADREQIKQRLLHALETGQSLSVLMGDIGFGKSHVARQLLDLLPEDKFEAVMLVLVHAEIAPLWLLRNIALRFDVKDLAAEPSALLGQIYERLVALHQSGRRAVIILDEAQVLSNYAIMEELRGLTNLEIPKEKLLHFVLVGLPELEQHLQTDLALLQRISMRCYLKPLTEKETEAYVTHRLQKSSGPTTPKDLFVSGAMARIHHFSGGVPRLIGILCDNALLEAFLAKEKTVSLAQIEKAAENLRLTT